MNTIESISSSDHVTEWIDAYVSGGLEPAERSALELHVAACSACAAMLEEARQADATLRELFTHARPDDAFEDHLVGRLRRRPQFHEAPADGPGVKVTTPTTGGRWRIRRPDWRMRWPVFHPLARLAASGVAAAIVLGAVGYGASQGSRTARSQA